MNVAVTHHAVEQFKNRVYASRNFKDEEIRKKLELTARRGKTIARRPGNALEKCFENIHVVTMKQGNTVVVLTCLGDRQYRYWSRAKELCPRFRKRAVS